MCTLLKEFTRPLIFAACLTAALSLCAFFRVSRPADLEAYRGMAAECHPVWRAFAFRQFSRGDSTNNLFAKFPPTRREEFGRYGIYRYGEPGFTGLSVVTKDGKLLSAGAGSCTWQFSFFQTKDPELDQQYAVFLKERHKRLERQRLGRLETQLRKFYSVHSRWPTNQSEFSFFVTGSPSLTTNDLGITLVERTNGIVEIALVELPGDKRSVTKPEQK